MVKKANGAYQTAIIKRFMSESEFNDFHDSYTEVCHRVRFMRVTDKDREFLKMYRGGLTLSEIAQKKRVSFSKVNGGIRRAALEIAIKS